MNIRRLARDSSDISFDNEPPSKKPRTEHTPESTLPGPMTPDQDIDNLPGPDTQDSDLPFLEEADLNYFVRGQYDK